MMTYIEIAKDLEEMIRYGRQDPETKGYNEAVMDMIAKMYDLRTKELLEQTRGGLRYD